MMEVGGRETQNFAVAYYYIIYIIGVCMDHFRGRPLLHGMTPGIVT